MRWVRSHARWGACLALFALVLQLGLAFGHVHLAGTGSAQAASSAGAHASAGATDGASLPGQPDDGAADDHCPICALIHLAGTLIPAAPPLATVPLVAGRLPRALAPDVGPATPPHRPFSARAPPTA